MRGRAFAAAALLMVLFAPACAYYNTFYSARKNFEKAESLVLRPDEPANAQQAAFYDKAMLSAGKVVTDYADSKWVDDALLMIGRIHLAKAEYPKARERLLELERLHPNSPLIPESRYNRAESYRRERKWEQAQALFDSVRAGEVPRDLQPWLTLRLAQLRYAQEDERGAIAYLQPLAAREDDEAWRAYLVHRTLGDAYFRLESFDSARTQYGRAADRAQTVELRHAARLREGESLEAGRRYREAVAFYTDLGKAANRPDLADQAIIRRANAMALDGRVREGLRELEDLIERSERTPMAAEARFQIGYIQEVLLEDLPAARASYAKLLEENRGTQSAQQAEARTKNLDRVEQLRASIAADTTGREQAATAALALAEQYLFELNRPDRAVEQYQQAESAFAGTEVAPKAAFAAAWVLERRLRRQASADSAFIRLVDRYPQSTYGRAASAFLRGQEDSLRAAGALLPTLVQHPMTPNAQLYVIPRFEIRPDRPRSPADTAHALPAQPDTTKRAWPPPLGPADSTGVGRPLPPDSLRAPADTIGAAPDTTRPRP